MKQACATFITALIALVLPTTALAANFITHGQNQPLTISGTHTLSLQCHVNDTAFLMSRLAVLDVGANQDHDIAITTGHGLIDKSGKALTDCTVRDFKGHIYKVNSVKVAENYAPGSSTDWAIVTFEKAKKTELVRYALAAPLETKAFDALAENKLPVRFSTARGLPGNGQDCAIIPRRFAGFDRVQYDGLLPHNCRAVSGQSGAPISVTRNGHNVIMGFHVGHAFLLQSPHNAGPSRHGYMRVFDEQLRTHVSTIITDITALETR